MDTEERNNGSRSCAFWRARCEDLLGEVGVHRPT